MFLVLSACISMSWLSVLKNERVNSFHLWERWVFVTVGVMGLIKRFVYYGWQLLSISIIIGSKINGLRLEWNISRSLIISATFFTVSI